MKGPLVTITRRNGRKDNLVDYIRLATLTDPSPYDGGVVEQLERKVEFLSELVGRLVEYHTFSRWDSDPAHLEELIFGENAGNIASVTLITPKPGPDPDVPF